MGYAVEPFLSTARLTPYRDAAGTNRALALYEWNCKISGEFFVILGQLEVVLRNAVDTNLRTSTLASTSGSWLHDQGTLRKEEIADIAKARSRRLAKHRGTNHDDIVSELNSGSRHGCRRQRKGTSPEQ